ncbi:MAG TPA: diacylglycerol kinase family protein [Polyangiaceae bacterium]|nr:diacylglycerol kinase family protein [Polyangiaceae bacterium]
MKIRVIVNPKAGAGAAGARLPLITRALEARGVAYDVVQTGGPGDATVLARRAREDGVTTIAVVGGDGTLNEVVQAYVGADGQPIEGPELALIPAGTGGDFRRALSVPKHPEAAVQRLLAGKAERVDLGVVDLTGDDGRPVRRAFVNIASFGVSGKIDRVVNRSPKWMGGRLAFALGSVRAMSTYRNAKVKVRVDGKDWYEGRVVVVAVANGRYFGGGMHIAPEAVLDDGLFDVVTVGDMSFLESLVVSPSLYRGKHLAAKRVTSIRGRLVEALPLGPEPVYVDTDGEAPGRLPLAIRVLPGALTVRA